MVIQIDIVYLVSSEFEFLEGRLLFKCFMLRFFKILLL